MIRDRLRNGETFAISFQIQLGNILRRMGYMNRETGIENRQKTINRAPL